MRIKVEDRWIKKSVALLAIRRGQADPVVNDCGKLVEIVMRVGATPPPHSDPHRFNKAVGSQKVLRIMKRAYQRSEGLLLSYPVKDQASRRGKDHNAVR